ncbi:hypothetical protein IB75_02595 [Nitrosococcus oceani C-27]|uniref:Uncharacterized protein n=1 Tax=Nitrosococcus oceani C-27 TaxID=314279 RepID=A0A0E2Z4A4_9GAMM|nr:hypothetical protein IB75_02595 [Nitrosococcus oceani C-27]KFI23644.1 hypothetical protein HW44_02685 [Nitrosococcus oceani]
MLVIFWQFNHPKITNICFVKKGKNQILFYNAMLISILIMSKIKFILTVMGLAILIACSHSADQPVNNNSH